MKRLKFPFLWTVLLLLVSLSLAFAGPVTTETIQGYLIKSGIKSRPAGTNCLEFETGFPGGKSFRFMVRADPKTRFLYLAVLDLARVDPKGKDFCAKAKKLLSFNYGLGLAKLEWEENTGEVRLSKSFATEGGLGKDQFLKALQTLLITAQELEPKLSALAE